MLPESGLAADVAVVVNSWQMKERSRDPEKSPNILVVLTGNSNDRFIDMTNYDFVVCVTWSTDHKKTTRWLPLLLGQLIHAAQSTWQEKVNLDVLGLPRGHCALMNVFEYKAREEDAWYLHLADGYRHLVGAGGCIYRQHNDAEYVNEILRGIDERRNHRGEDRKVFPLIVLSRLDNATKFSGEIESHKTSTMRHRVQYTEHTTQIEDDVEDLRILALASHMEKVQKAIEWTDELCETSVIPAMEPDVSPTNFLSLLVKYSKKLKEPGTVVPRNLGREQHGGSASHVEKRIFGGNAIDPRTCQDFWPTCTEFSRTLVDKITNEESKITTSMVTPGQGRAREFQLTCWRGCWQTNRRSNMGSWPS